jgi:hypothetical protein
VDIAGPQQVLDTLPSHLRAVTLADTAALCQEGQPQQGSISAIVLLVVVYLVFAVPTIMLAIGAYTPCTSNFEGGCDMAKGF